MNQVQEKKLLKKINAFLMWVLVVDILLLVLPYSIFNENLSLFINEHKYILWLIFIVCISNFISQLLIYCFNKAVLTVSNKARIERISKAINCLDFSEKALIREFILQRKSVLSLPINEPSVRNLIELEILTPTDNIINENGNINTMITIDARQFITYKAVGLSKGKMSEEQIEQIMSARPSYAKKHS